MAQFRNSPPADWSGWSDNSLYYPRSDPLSGGRPGTYLQELFDPALFGQYAKKPAPPGQFLRRLFDPALFGKNVPQQAPPGQFLASIGVTLPEPKTVLATRPVSPTASATPTPAEAANSVPMNAAVGTGEPRIVARGGLWPISRDENGRIGFDSDVGVLGAFKRAVMLPGDTWAGRIDPGSDEGIARAEELAGFITLGGFPAAVVRKAPSLGTGGGKLVADDVARARDVGSAGIVGPGSSGAVADATSTGRLAAGGGTQSAPATSGNPAQPFQGYDSRVSTPPHVSSQKAEYNSRNGAPTRQTVNEIDRPAVQPPIGAAPESAVRGPYANLQDSPSVGAGKEFTRSQKRKMLKQNIQMRGGSIKSDGNGTVLSIPQKSRRGVTPPDNEAQIDHIVPRNPSDPSIAPGTNSFANAQILSRAENRAKSNKRK